MGKRKLGKKTVYILIIHPIHRMNVNEQLTLQRRREEQMAVQRQLGRLYRQLRMPEMGGLPSSAIRQIWQNNNQRVRPWAWQAVRNAVPNIRHTPNQGPYYGNIYRTFFSAGHTYKVERRGALEDRRYDLQRPLIRVYRLNGVQYSETPIAVLSLRINDSDESYLIFNMYSASGSMQEHIHTTLPVPWRLEIKAVISAVRQLLFHWHPALVRYEIDFHMPASIADIIVNQTEPQDLGNSGNRVELDERVVMQSLFGSQRQAFPMRWLD